MDGKLTGRLSPRQRLSGRLSFSIRDAPGIVLIKKVISCNGSYRARADDADGYSQVAVEVPATIEPLVPHAFDLTGGYVMSGTWIIGGDTVNYSDVYEVQSNQPYLIMLGNRVGTRFRAMFSETDTAAAQENVVGRSIVNTSNPAACAYVTFKPTADGYITITKDNAGTAGLKTYVFRLEDLIDE
ncbi:MAG: hypothetical protein IJG40_13415 [Oscillospiraceae bacterium]|nr:hypothetical protein [Oscillospiraceae bacterium]